MGPFSFPHGGENAIPVRNEGISSYIFSINLSKNHCIQKIVEIKTPAWKNQLCIREKFHKSSENESYLNMTTVVIDVIFGSMSMV